MDRLNKKMMHAQIVDSVDQGLRSFMLGVYNYMLLGLTITGLVAYLGATVPGLQQVLFNVTPDGVFVPSGFTWVLIIAQFAMIFLVFPKLYAMERTTAQLTFVVWAALMGLTLSSIFMVYTGASLFRVFLITAGTFGSFSLYGYVTKRNLMGMSGFFRMALIGLIIAMVVNIFFHSTAFDLAISVIGVVIFSGLTAYNTQALKAIYFEGDSADMAGRKAILGALMLYMNFVNLFLFLLRLLGNRR